MQGFECFCFNLDAISGRNWDEVTAKVLSIYPKFLRIQGLERSRFYRRVHYLMPLLQLICLYFNQLDFDELVIIDSFPVLLCQPVRNHQAKVLNEVANIGYCASKNMWFYGFKIHLAVTESGYILDYLVTPVSVHDIQVAEELLDAIPYTPVLADLDYLGKELKKRLEAKGIDFLTPICKNMKGAAEHNNPAILTIRRTIETRISVLNSLFNIEHPLARSLAGLQLEIERAILVYNLGFFIN